MKRILAKSQATGIRWKEDPIKRAELPRVLHFFEWRTLRFSFPRGSLRFLTFDFAVDFSNLSIGLAFPKSELHPELEIHQQLTGEDPKSVVREMWRRHYGRIICATVNEAQQKLQTAMQLSFDKIDRVVVAGGSSRLPFVKDKEEITLVLPSMVEKNSIHIGSDIGEAVAY